MKKENPSYEEKMFPLSINFYGATTQIDFTKFRRVVIKNEQTKAISDKFLSIIRNLPQGCKMSSPKFFQVGNKNYAYSVDKKTNSNNINFILKSNVENLKEWDNENNIGTILDCTFDKRGFMQTAKLESISDTMKKNGATYHHTGKEGRRININDKIYRPRKGCDNLWTFVPNSSSRNITGSFDLQEELNDIEFADLFLEFAKNRTSVLLK